MQLQQASGHPLPSPTSPHPVPQVWRGPGSDQAPSGPSLPARTVNSSPRSHNVQATWCWAPRTCPPSPPEGRQGRRQAGFAPCFRVGGLQSPLRLSLLPWGSPSGRGHACLGDPNPQNLPSVCLFAVCSKLVVLTLVLTMNVTRSILCVPPDTHTHLCLLLPFAAPCVWPITPAPQCCCYQHQNKHTHGSHSTWPPVLSGLQQPGSGLRQMSHPLAG